MNLKKICWLLALPFGLFGQSNSVSPYSRFALGDAVTSVFMQGLTTGHLSSALRDPFNLNLNNPAASNALRLTTLEMAGKLVVVDQRTQDLGPVEQTYASFNYFALGIPISKRYGISIGALPFTAVGYQLSESEQIDGIGQVTRQYQGTGGLNKLYLNQSFECFDGFHLGLQAVYYFGNLEYFQDIRYDDASFFSSRYETDYLVSDMNWKFGLQYARDLDDGNKELVLGLTWEGQNTLGGTFSQTAFTYSPVGNTPFPRDTLDSQFLDDDLRLPGSWSGGLVLGGKHPDIHHYSWMVGLDVYGAAWADASGREGETPLTNSLRIGLGGEMTPRYALRPLYRSRNSLADWKFRAGGFLYRSPIELRGEGIDTYGMTFGVGIPLRIRGLAPGEERNNTINVGYSYSVRGTLEQGLIREQINQFVFGVTLNDRWFIKYKYR